MCECCKKINFIKDMNKETINEIKRELKASLTSIAMQGKEVRGTVRCGTFDINYCPMCGRKLGE